jgi:cytidyltransferase-like protein
MEFLRRASGQPTRVGVLAAAFNPPTVAHLSLARSALEHVDEVAFVLPQVFPHKPYEGAPLEVRVAMLRAAIAHEPAFSLSRTADYSARSPLNAAKFTGPARGSPSSAAAMPRSASSPGIMATPHLCLKCCANSTS